MQLTGYAPTLVVGTRLTPLSGSLTLTGIAPTLAATANVFVTPLVGSLALQGYAPSIPIPGDTAITPGAGSLSLTGLAATLGLGITPASAQLAFVLYAPTVSVSTGALKLTASGVAGKSKYMAGYGVAPYPFGV